MKTRKLTVGSLKTIKVEPVKFSETKMKDVKFKPKNDFKQEKQVKQKIEVMQNSKTFTITPNQKNRLLLDLALDQNQLLAYKCKKGSCGKCTVKVMSGNSCLKEVTTQEQKKLQDQVNFGYRLACQAIVNCD
ncbi:2Fe-2S iron-sulfur cluster binding domain-containing protein [Alkalihalobacillus sp. BA299]|uniref:2Fe-2S iron-sulfur cluster-binding protein n=1 Tax=Alkalihalobacillus sp. BA299 TaxID=2815938 RepID=UPI001ADCB37D|nr:2Fe-2S iron-sulfur cluster binding domain-containing protein [Alkalihalobacillus sp. BA299]